MIDSELLTLIEGYAEDFDLDPSDPIDKRMAQDALKTLLNEISALKSRLALADEMADFAIASIAKMKSEGLIGNMPLRVENCLGGLDHTAKAYRAARGEGEDD